MDRGLLDAYGWKDVPAACRFQSNIKPSRQGKLPWRYRWRNQVRDDVLARLLAVNGHRAELERLTAPASRLSPSRA